ncbi:MAG: hypothetical protein AB1938_23395 [Myxococcota bacterium]
MSQWAEDERLQALAQECPECGRAARAHGVQRPHPTVDGGWVEGAFVGWTEALDALTRAVAAPASKG